MNDCSICKNYEPVTAKMAGQKTAKGNPDVVQVVRCKDCVWYVKSEGVCTMVSSRGEPGVPIQCYCSHGVRRCKEGME